VVILTSSTITTRTSDIRELYHLPAMLNRTTDSIRWMMECIAGTSLLIEPRLGSWRPSEGIGSTVESRTWLPSRIASRSARMYELGSRCWNRFIELMNGMAWHGLCCE